MDFEKCFNNSPAILMEGAIGERLKREHNVVIDDKVELAALIYNDRNRHAMLSIIEEYVAIAQRYNLPFIATAPTRRANRERVHRSTYNKKIIEDNVNFMFEIKNRTSIDMFIGGLMGCKGDAYKATEILSKSQAYQFHSWQANLFKKAGVDFLFAGIMPALSEAIGMANAIEATGLPYVISFMIRSDGKLIDGTTIHDAILNIDNETIRQPICYMTNCVHPTILKKALSCTFNQTELVKERFRGIQANASPLSPEELDNCCDLQCVNSKSLAFDMMDLNNCINLKIFGGCCGTDNTHIEEITKRLIGTTVENT